MVNSDTDDLDKYHKAILNFIAKNEDCTEHYVRTNMKGRGCSPMTTRRKISSLLQKGLIEDRKVGNGFHKLRITDNTHFNLILIGLKKIDEVIDIMDLPIRNISDLVSVRNESKKFGDVTKLFASSYKTNLLRPYNTMVWEMLRTLLYQLNDVGISNHDSTLLHKETVRLMKKLDDQYHDIDESKKFIDRSVEVLKRTRKNLLDIGNIDPIMNVTIVDNLLKINEDFQRILAESDKSIS